MRSLLVRATVIILNELRIDAGLLVRILSPGLHEEATFVSMNYRLDDHHIGNLGRSEFHYSPAARIARR